MDLKTQPEKEDNVSYKHCHIKQMSLLNTKMEFT